MEGMERPDPDDEFLDCTREVLKLGLQEPQMAGEIFDLMPPESFEHPTYVSIANAVAHAGGTAASRGGAAWLDQVSSHIKDAMGRAVISELAVEDLHCTPDRLPFYADAIMARMQERWVGNEIADMKSRLERIRPDRDFDEYKSLFADLMVLEKYRRSLQDRAAAYGEFTPQ